MRPIVDEVLHDDHTGVRQRHRQGVVGLSVFHTPCSIRMFLTVSLRAKGFRARHAALG